MSDIVYDIPIGEVAKILEKSDRQVRRYVKESRLKARPVRIGGHIKLMFNRDQVVAFKEHLAHGDGFDPSREIVVDARLLESGDGASMEDAEPIMDTASVTETSAVKYVVDALREQIRDLHKENRDLHYQLEQRSGQVGFLQGKIETLQEEIKMLAPAQESQEELVERKPWYRRIFGRG